MGTRSLTKVIEKYDDGSKKTITTMYRQYDGYPAGHGIDLAVWLQQYTIVNGLRTDETRLVANGEECLAAQMFSHFKDGPGGIYCMHPDAKDCGEEYIYEIQGSCDKNLSITIRDVWKKKIIFEGSPKELLIKYDETIEIE